jgi:hypothetical protein
LVEAQVELLKRVLVEMEFAQRGEPGEVEALELAPGEVEFLQADEAGERDRARFAVVGGEFLQPGQARQIDACELVVADGEAFEIREGADALEVFDAEIIELQLAHSLRFGDLDFAVTVGIGAEGEDAVEQGLIGNDDDGRIRGEQAGGTERKGECEEERFHDDRLFEFHVHDFAAGGDFDEFIDEATVGLKVVVTRVDGVDVDVAVAGRDLGAGLHALAALAREIDRGLEVIAPGLESAKFETAAVVGDFGDDTVRVSERRHDGEGVALAVFFAESMPLVEIRGAREERDGGARAREVGFPEDAGLHGGDAAQRRGARLERETRGGWIEGRGGKNVGRLGASGLRVQTGEAELHEKEQEEFFHRRGIFQDRMVSGDCEKMDAGR